MKKTFIFILILFVAYSCAEKVYDSELIEALDTIEIIPSKAERVNYSQIFDTVSYIQLPTDDEFLIGSIDKIIHKDSFVIILDKTITHSVFILNEEDGTTLKIHKLGSGPGDYVAASDVIYKEESRELGIYCKMRNVLLYYDLNGNFIREEKVPYHAEKIRCFEDGYAFFADYGIDAKLRKMKRPPNLFLVKNDKILSQADYFNRNINKTIVWTSHPDFSEIDKNKYSINPDHSNYIYHVTPDSIYAAYHLDFGQYNIDSRYWKQAEKRGAKFLSVEDYSDNLGLCNIYPVLEDADFIFFNYKQKKKRYTAFYSKRTKTLINADNFLNDMDQITAFYPMKLQDGKIYCLLNAEDINTAWEYLSENQLLPPDILENVEDYDNPVIVIFTLKDF